MLSPSFMSEKITFPLILRVAEREPRRMDTISPTSSTMPVNMLCITTQFCHRYLFVVCILIDFYLSIYKKMDCCLYESRRCQRSGQSEQSKKKPRHLEQPDKRTNNKVPEMSKSCNQKICHHLKVNPKHRSEEQEERNCCNRCPYVGSRRD